MKAIVYVGAAGSGKSTVARNAVAGRTDAVIVERDIIRATHGLPPIGDKDQERFVTKVQNSQIEAALLDGMEVHVSNTNTNKGIRNSLIKQIHKYGADVEVVIVHPPLDVVLAQNAQRGDAAVPEHVVRKMWQSVESQRAGIESEYPVERYAPYSHDATKSPVYCVDLDGTIADCTGIRSPYDYTKVGLDRPIRDVCGIVNDLSKTAEIIFVSGRKDTCRSDTLYWLRKQFDFPIRLYMRKADDDRADYIVKNEIYDERIIPMHNIFGVLDDRQQVVTHLRSRGITVLQVAPGRF